MTFNLASTVLDRLRDLDLIPETKLAEVIDSIPGGAANSDLLLDELVRREWLTSFQAGELRVDSVTPLSLGPYILLERLGTGGMGEVYKARHRGLGRAAALKVIRKDRLPHAEAVARFYREARAAAQLKHPNIVTIYDINQDAGNHFLAMELVEGMDLGRKVSRHGILPMAEACEVIRQAALGLQHAFQKGLVHRDIKPSNLMMGTMAEVAGPVTKILDFGLARIVEEPAGDAGLTPSNQLLGTPDFMAPEQAENSKTADIRADIFSLGCTLFYILTGRQPFAGDSPMSKLASRFRGEPRTARSLLPELPVELDRVLGRMLALDPSQRYQTPIEVAGALEPFSKSVCQTIDFSPRSELPTVAKPVLPLSSEGTPPLADVDVSSTARPVGETQAGLGKSIRKWWGLGVTLTGALAGLALVWFLSLRREGEKQPPSPPGEITHFTNSIGMELVRIPAGKFLRGSPDNEEGSNDLESPRAWVRISRPFFMGIYEVTQAEYVTVMETNPSEYGPQGKGWAKLAGQDVRRFPVENVSWEDAQEFCRRLSARPEEKGRRYRLPTEAEWEYACRAGTTTPFFFGNTLNASQANSDTNRPYGGAKKEKSLGHPAAVGSYPSNAFGLFDMHGNVWEWCQDYFGPYTMVAEDPKGPNTGNDRIFRGGAWALGGRNVAPPSADSGPPLTGALTTVFVWCAITRDLAAIVSSTVHSAS
jgi:formylglycine-generating enzyme required for sulfatase activity/tRNA A-37 threonylcarbamoyl transferase component Bud32